MHKPPTDVEFHALFSTQEAIFKYICEGENPTLCFFDLEKAFDSIEYPRFQGVLNPLTGRSAFEVFVIPVLLYGCETWILTPALLSKLEKLESEIGKAPIIGLHQSTYSSTKNQFSCKLQESVRDDLASCVFRT